MPRQIIDLDALNPEPQVFVLKGRELRLEHLPHKDFYDLSERAERVQEAQAAGDARVRDAERSNLAIVMDLFGRFNPWLVAVDEAAYEAADTAWKKARDDNPVEAPPEPAREDFVGVWFGDVSLAALVYLLRSSFEYLQGSYDEQVERGGSENGRPPGMRVLPPARQRR